MKYIHNNKQTNIIDYYTDHSGKKPHRQIDRDRVNALGSLSSWVQVLEWQEVWVRILLQACWSPFPSPLGGWLWKSNIYNQLITII